MATRSNSRPATLLLELLDGAMTKASWHGPNLGSVIRGVDFELAWQRLPGRKSIWEQVLHAAYWKQIVLNKLIGTQRFPRAGSNWPKVPQEPSDRAWREDVQLLYEIHARLRDAVSKADLDQLDEKTKRMIWGAAFHDIYHAGQIRLLRKILKT